MFGFFIDYYYIVLVVPMVILALIAQVRVKTTFSKYSKAYADISGAEAAEKTLRANGVYNVKIERVSGNLTDHFDPRTNVIRLSDSVYDSCTVSAVGVACHEAGHAVQYAENYSPILFRNKLVPVVNFGSSISWIMLLLGIFLSYEGLIWLGIALFGLSTLFHLVTLPVELNASRRAILAIKNGSLLVNERDINGAIKVLSAAAWTYIAALLVSLAQFLRLVLLFGKRRD